MASIKKVTVWSVIGSLWTAWWLFIIVWITIYDYPRVNIYEGWFWDKAWFWHEIGLVLSIYIPGMLFIWIGSLVESVNGLLRGLQLLPDGRLVLVRKKRF
jgi:energy-coupling factor transporter transmembrane protein EcfT